MHYNQALKGFTKGFTLAEVLITLGVIGVVAAIVIPGMINKTNDAELKTMLKKNYSVLSSATKQIINDYGSMGSIPGHADAAVKMAPIYARYLNTVGGVGSWPSGTKLLNGSTDNPAAWLPAWAQTLTLNDGTLVGFVSMTGACGHPCGTTVWQTNNQNMLFSIVVDVNGYKGPNTVGKDIYSFALLNDANQNQLLPQGSPGIGTQDCTTADFGWSCTALYLRQ